ncbi:integrase family protein [Burkholderia cenocepacia]|uniref:tyrosine-type recombinase/integrase n=1 Tax=Burkholderia cenocepacia TaxID=95486 RepID=UPI00285C5FE0|nr:integrase family protein [Burkholderia cenocepacia]MDR8076687.1 integrase family protein [Burkholderia cenocepacia]
MSNDKQITFSKKTIDAIPFAPKGQQITYYDTKTQGFGLRVGTSTKTFILYARVKRGAPVRVSLGKYGVLTVDQARERAIQELVKLNSGIDPNKEKKQKAIEEEHQEKETSETLKWLLDTYKEEHIIKKKGGSEGTLRSMSDTYLYFGPRTVETLKQVNGVWVKDGVVELSDWMDRPYRSITSHDVLERFKIYEVAAPSRAQKVLKPIKRSHQITFRFLRAAYNYQIPRAAHANPNDIIQNPVNVLSIFDHWEEPDVRERFVDFEEHEFLSWWTAVENYNFYNGLVKDYLIFSLIQGGRSIEIAPLKKSQVDMKKRLITYIDTKNKQDYYFPITDLAYEILQRRIELAGNSEYVFAYPKSRKGYVTQDCRHHFEQISKESGKLISHHDLRRTFGTAARKLKIDSLTIDYCLKHTIKSVNKHYFMNKEREITEALQSVENFFLERLAKLCNEKDKKKEQFQGEIDKDVERFLAKHPEFANIK